MASSQRHRRGVSSRNIRSPRWGENRKVILFAFFCLLFVFSGLSPGAETRAGSAAAGAYLLEDEPSQAGEAGFLVEGRLVPHQFANLSLRLDGRVEEVFVQAGDQVEAGQVLLRLGGGEELLADVATAEMDLLLAQQALEALVKNAGLQRALTARELAGVKKEWVAAEYRVERIRRGAPQLAIDQAYANMVLSEKALDQARDNLSRTERQFDDGKDPIWMFVSRKQVRLLITTLEREVAVAQKRYEDSARKYQDLIAPPDEIELALAESNLAVVETQMGDAEERYAALSDGPDPDELAAVQARIRVAETALEASKQALQELELRAPFAGTVVDLGIKPGEWAEVGRPVVVLASLTAWRVETEDLTEIQVPGLELGQRVTVSPQALPELALAGTVETIGKISEVKQGDVTYTAKILVDESDPRLRWGMTVTVDFGK